MSDFLDSLLKGYFKQAELIQPRLLSWFEPPSAIAEARDRPDTVPVLNDQPSEDQTADEDLTQPPFILQAAVTAPPSSTATPLKTETALFFERHSKSAAVPLPTSPFEDLLNHIKPDEIEPNRTSLFEPHLPLKPDTISIQQNAAGSLSREVTQVAQPPLQHTAEAAVRTSQRESESQPSLQHPSTIHAVPADAPTRLKSMPVLISLLARRSASTEAKKTGTLEPVSPSSEAQSEAVTPLTTPIVIAPQARPAAALQPDRAITRSAPPVVRITIGRVEVHAIMPPPSTPSPAPTRRAAPLSLDKYLKQVNGRRE